MTAVQPSPGGAAAVPSLAFDTRADEVVGDHRAERARALSARDRVAVALLGGAFALASVVIAWTIAWGGNRSLAVSLVYVLVYALVSRVEFEVFTGAAAPTELVLVPMLFVLPLAEVPLAVAGGLVFGSIVDCLARRASLGRAPFALLSAWHAVGPVVVLGLVWSGELSLRRWPVYVAALAAQFVVEAAAVSAYEAIAHRVRPTQILPHLGRVQLVDAMLAPAGLAVAFATRDEPYAIVLCLPLVWLLSIFARERRARIDNALELSTAYRGTAFLLGDVVEADDAYTGLHSRDVVELSVSVAEELGLADADRRDVEFVALLHDVGKIRMPAEIINKKGPLTPEERAVIETHTLEGEKLLEQVGGLLGRVGRIVRSCHERWDGNGYPDGLAGAAIPLVARIVMCCDAFSAMTTDRSYRKAMALPEAIGELRANSGSQFDPQVVDALIAVIARRPDRAT